MHRRKRIRKRLMGEPMEVDGDGLDHESKPVKAAKRELGPTNIETLTSQLQKVSIKQLASEQKKKKKPKYIDTSKLLNFKREARYPKKKDEDET